MSGTPSSFGIRKFVARAAGLGVLLGCLYVVWVAQRGWRGDYAVLLYNAQRVNLLLDRAPLLYAIPFCLLLSAATTALLNGGGARVQCAAAMLLLFASGYAPRAPGRLLTMTLGFVLLARAVAAFERRSRPPA